MVNVHVVSQLLFIVWSRANATMATARDQFLSGSKEKNMLFGKSPGQKTFTWKKVCISHTQIQTLAQYSKSQEGALHSSVMRLASSTCSIFPVQFNLILIITEQDQKKSYM